MGSPPPSQGQGNSVAHGLSSSGVVAAAVAAAVAAGTSQGGGPIGGAIGGAATGPSAIGPGGLHVSVKEDPEDVAPGPGYVDSTTFSSPERDGEFEHVHPSKEIPS